MSASVKGTPVQVLLLAGLIAMISSKALCTEPEAQSSKNPNIDKAMLAESYGKLPLTFEANAGQTDKRVRFISRGSGYGLFLTGDAAVLALDKAECAGQPASLAQRGGRHVNLAGCARETDVVTMRLAGHTSASASPAGEEKLPGVANYFVGSDPTAWRTGLPMYAKVRYSGVYPGVDLLYYGNQKQLEYDFVVAPQADPRAIRLQFSGVSKLKVDGAGDLILSAGNGDIAFHRPVVYQEQNGRRQWIDGRFTLGRRHTVSFSLSGYDHTRPVVIDPVLTYSTYLGGSGNDGDEALAIAVDANGDAYVTGQTDSTNFPLTSGSYQQSNQGAASGTYNAFVSKLNSTGKALVYSTFLGGSGNTQGAALAVDSSGDAYVAGHTFATDFPTTSGAYQTASPSCYGGYSAFVTKLNSTGTALVYSTYLGGNGNSYGSGTGDIAYALVLDSSGDAYVTGATQSSNFPVTSGAYQATNTAAENNASAAFVTKLNPAGSALVFSTYLSGSGQYDGGDSAYALALNSSGDVYVTGSAGSSDFPVTTGAFQTTNPASAEQQTAAFVTELNSTGTALLYSTFLGGSEDAAGAGLAVDISGDAYVAGYAMSTNFPVTTGAFQTTNNAAAIDATTGFVTKLNPTGTALIYSTLLGGSGVEISTYNTEGDSADGLAIDASGDAYVTGMAYSTNFPVTSGAIQSTSKGAGTRSFVSFVTEVNPAGTGLAYSTYLGGSGTPFGNMNYYRGDDATGLALDSAGNIYIAGATYSSNFPVTSGAFQYSNMAVNSSGSNAFISKISMGGTAATATTTALASSANPANTGTSVTFTATVTPSSGSTVPTGTVVFTLDGTAEPGVTLGTSGTAIFATSSLAGGSHTVSAAYGGSSSFGSSASSSLTETISEPTAATPAFSPAVGTYTSVQSVTLSSATSGAAIYYTTNGNTPTTASTMYTGAISVGASETIEAITVASGYNNSQVASGAYTINLPAAATPAFSVASGTYTTAQSVTLTDATSGATIYYTTNGATPTTSSTVYSGAISVGTTETITAIAAAPGYSNSAVASAAYTVTLPAATPAFSLATGSYKGAQSLTMTDSTSGAAIYYTTNATTPTASSTLYTGAITVGSTETVEAIAVAPGYLNSAVKSAAITITAAPTATTAAATSLTATGATLNATISANYAATSYWFSYGTTSAANTTTTTKTTGISGATPTAVSLALTGLQAATTYYFKVVGSNSVGNIAGTVLSFTTPQVTAVATPTFSVAGGTYTSTQSVAISDATSGATIHYTTNGVTPTTSSTVYSGAISVSSTETIEAIATAPGYLNSAASSAVYTISSSNSKASVATPAFSLATASYKGAQSLTMTDSTSGAAIYYTTNGTTPTSSSTLYTGAIAVCTTETIEAIAIAPGYLNSAVKSAAITITALPTVTTAAATSLTATAATLNATITANYAATSYWFSYGTTSAANTTTTTKTSGISGATPTAVSVTLTGLQPATTYYFKVVGSNSVGNAAGTALSFTTP